MQRSLVAEQAAEPKSYVFLVFSTDMEVEKPDELLSSITGEELEGFKLEKITVLRNPAYRPF